MKRISLLALHSLTMLALGQVVPQVVQGQSLAGHLFLLTKSGDIKRGAATEVFLLKRPAGLESLYTALCDTQEVRSKERHEAGIAAIRNMPDSNDRLIADKYAALAAFNELYLPYVSSLTNERRALIWSAAWSSAPTGIDAHFSFTTVPPGQYTLVATMTLGDYPKDWFVPVTIEAGQQITVDLDNNNMYQERWSCDQASPVK